MTQRITITTDQALDAETNAAILLEAKLDTDILCAETVRALNWSKAAQMLSDYGTREDILADGVQLVARSLGLALQCRVHLGQHSLRELQVLLRRFERQHENWNLALLTHWRAASEPEAASVCCV